MYFCFFCFLLTRSTEMLYLPKIEMYFEYRKKEKKKKKNKTKKKKKEEEKKE